MEKEPGDQAGETARRRQANQPTRAEVPQLVPYVQAAQRDGALRRFAHSGLPRAGGTCFGVGAYVRAKRPNRLAVVLGSIRRFVTSEYEFLIYTAPKNRDPRSRSPCLV